MNIDRKALANMDFRAVTTGKKLAPVHPGDVLMHDFIEPMGLTRYKVAKLANVQQRRIDEICVGKRSITADTALRLAKLFGMDAQTWMNLQAQYDLETTESELGEQINKEVTTLQAAA
jgi:addiction module HigA family antidote